ncbi:hypothetical protein PGTUg99_012340 [Puccinia graminis f. sp. tritici]|uniref:Uncharacterized protein n=1 Tax=Puccinia graminis f. sp. tritici TaxID=56615 RepID=A0A5B0LIC7_PUCGR|nr:hypothetical protein PGTUg99_012340 [Puccinia graminis f. sp. tritici]
MRSFVAVACFLAAFAAATPVDLQARQISSSVQAASGHDASHQSSTSSSPFGYSHQQSDSEHSYSQYSSVTNSMAPVFGTIGQIQNLMSQGSFTESSAMSYMSRLAQQLQPAFDGIRGCGCLQDPTVVSSYNSMFSQLYQLFQSFQSQYGQNFIQIVARKSTVSPSPPRLSPDQNPLEFAHTFPLWFVTAFGGLFNSFSQFQSESHQSQSFSQFSNSFNPLVSMLGSANPSFNTLGQF